MTKAEAYKIILPKIPILKTINATQQDIFRNRLIWKLDWMRLTYSFLLYKYVKIVTLSLVHAMYISLVSNGVLYKAMLKMK